MTIRIRPVAAAGLALALCACGSRAERAEKAFREVAAMHDNEGACTAARNAQKAYLDEGNGVKAQEMKHAAEGYCAMAQVIR